MHTQKILLFSMYVGGLNVHEENDSEDEVSAREKYSEIWTSVI